MSTHQIPRMLDLFTERPWFGVEDYFLLDHKYDVSAIEVRTIGIVVILAFLFTGMAAASAIQRRTAPQHA